MIGPDKNKAKVIRFGWQRENFGGMPLFICPCLSVFTLAVILTYLTFPFLLPCLFLLLLPILEDTARYAGLLLAPVEGFFGGQRKKFILLFWPIFGNFWCPVVNLVTFCRNLSKFKRNPKNQKNPKKIQKRVPRIIKNKKIPYKITKIRKLSKIVKKS